MIIAISFRIKSKEGTKFRIWTNEKLKEYRIKRKILDIYMLPQLIIILRKKLQLIFLKLFKTKCIMQFLIILLQK